MKFICTQENILEALSLVTPITGKNLSLPILNNILVLVSGTDITISSTNLEIAVTTRLRGKTEGDGSFTALGKLLRDFVALQPNGKIEFSIKDHDVHLQSQSSKTAIKTTPADDFPVIPKINEKANRVDISMDVFTRAVRTILPTISLNESRPELAGLYMQFMGESLVLAGTDSYRLAEYTIALGATPAVEGNYIVPLRSIQEVLRIFEHEKTVQFIFTENQFACKSENTEIVSRLIEGTYPDYRQIIPTEEKTTISINCAECTQAVKAASLFCKSGVNDIEISTKKNEKLLVVAAANNQVGENITTLPGIITGDDTTIIFNYRYVLDALSVIETEDVLVSLNGPESTGVFRPTDDSPFLHLVMPIRQ
ncbi:MAG: DNA polymerase III subunit beta [Patescibacteria group bacterium]|jgi:DNA polymerase-3 subunit beta